MELFLKFILIVLLFTENHIYQTLLLFSPQNVTSITKMITIMFKLIIFLINFFLNTK